MANLSKVIYINETDYSTLLSGGTISKGGTTYSYDDTALYVIKDVSAPEYASTAGYATNAGSAQNDGSGNNIAQTYSKRVVYFASGNVDDNIVTSNDTIVSYDTLKALVADPKTEVVIVCNNYELHAIDISSLENNLYFGCVENTRTLYLDVYNVSGNAVINDYSDNDLAYDNGVVHKANTETITGNKTFTGSVSLGSNATATTPAASDNDTSVATTAFVKTALQSFTETDPVFSASAAATITSSDITNWNGKSNFSGSYNDLTNKPTIPNDSNLVHKTGDETIFQTKTFAANGEIHLASGWHQIYNDDDDESLKEALKARNNVQADWNQTTTTAADYIKNKPTIPAAPGTLNTTATTGQSANASESLSGNITLHKISKTGSYTDLIGRPTITSIEPSGSSHLTDVPVWENMINAVPVYSTTGLYGGNNTTSDNYNDVTYYWDTAPTSESTKAVTSGGVYTALSGKADSSSLATVATSGNYNDLNNKPTIPATYAGSSSVGGAANKAAAIPFGKVDSSSTSHAFTATVEGITELRDGTCCYLKNDVVTSAAASTAPKCWTLNINNLGAKPVYVTTAAATYSTTHFTKNYRMLFTYDESLNSGNGGWYIGVLYNTNSTYGGMTVAEITAGTSTTNRLISPKNLRNYFYTEDEVDTLLGSKANSNDLATVAISGSYNDLDDKPTIPAAQVNSDWNASSGVAQILNKPTIPTVPTALSAFTDDLGSNPTHTHSQYLTSAPVTSVNGQTGAVNLTIPDVSGKADKVVVVNAATLPASLEPNKVYQLGTLTGSVTIPAFSSVQSGDTEVKIWCFTFSTSTTAPTITWPAGITAWSGGSAPTINASKSYEVTVMDGIGVIIEA